MEDDPLRNLYREMLWIRLVEEEIAARYSEQEMRCPVHLSIGQEATPVGVCACLTPEDYAFGSHRSHGHYLAKGGDLQAMLGELYGKAIGCCQGKGGSMHLVDLKVGFLGATSIVASTIPIAVGAAFASALRGERRVTVVFLGEAAVEEGVFHEAANFASLKKLPVLFICENNLYSVYSPLSVRQPEHRAVAEVAGAHGIPAWQGDGNDPLEVMKLTSPAVQRAREGGGPAFLEFATYRWREHCGASYDNHIGYRTEAEFQEWKRRCPLERLKERLLFEALATAADLEAMERELRATIEAAFTAVKASPFPAPERMLEQVYAP